MPVSDTDQVMAFSPNGTLLATTTPQGVTVYRVPPPSELLPEQPEVFCVIPRASDTRCLSFSPQGSFLITGDRRNKEAEHDNVMVWSLSDIDSDGHPKGVWGLSIKVVNRDTWPFFFWTDDEKWMLHSNKNELVLHDGKNPAVVSHRIRIAGLESFAPSPIAGPSNHHHVAVFVPGKQGQPARLNVVELPINVSTESTQFIEEPKIQASKSIMKANSAEILWNSLGTCVLIKAQTDVDTTGKTYYGESNLIFMKVDGSQNQQINAGIDGPVHTMAWSPTGKEFIAVMGSMPARIVLHDTRGEPKFDFGRGSRNTIRFSRSGKLLVIGGFGNLTGDMDFYVRRGNKYERLGSSTAHMSVNYDWSPDGRHFLTSVCAPRMRVDNGFHVYKYDGSLLHSEAIEELYETLWQPCHIPETPISPRSSKDAKPLAPEPVKAYRPPNATGALAARMREERSETRFESGPRRITLDEKVSKSVELRNLPPGADPEEYKKQLKKLEKKNRQKEKKAEQKQTIKAKATAVTTAKPVVEEDLEKKAKAIRKKLRQIADIRAKEAAGETLDEAQKEKISREGELQEELAKYESS